MAWLPVGFGWDDLYEVSDDGEVRRLGALSVLKGSAHRGYKRVQFSRPGGEAPTFLIHKLVADAFFGQRPEGAQIDHINGDRGDNCAANLRYCTPKQNIHYTMDRDAHARGELNAASVLTDEHVRMIRQRKASGGRYWGAAEIAAELGVGESTVRQAARGFRYGHVAAEPRQHGEKVSLTNIRNLVDGRGEG